MVMPTLAGRALIVSLTNQELTAAPAARLAVLDPANTRSFLLAQDAGDVRVLGVTMHAIEAGESGRIQTAGVCVCLVEGAVLLGHYLRASATAGALEDTGELADATTPAPAGSCAIALEAGLDGDEIAVYLTGVSGAGVGAFADLLDVPEYYDNAGRYLRINALEDGLEAADAPAAGPATQIEETSGPDVLDVDAIADGEYLRRSGSTIIGDTPSGGPGGGSVNYDPDLAPSSPSAVDDEFDDEALDGDWTSYGSPDILSETELKGFLHIEKTSNGTESGVTRPYVPGAAALTIAAKIYADVSEAGSNQAGFILRTGAGAVIVSVGFLQGGSVIVGAAALSGGFDFFQYNFLTTNIGKLYFALQRDATTNYAVWISADGIQWKRITTFSQAGTIGQLTLFIQEFGPSKTSAYIDFVRAFLTQTLEIGNTP